MSCGCVPSPTPRLASSSSLRSNTTASQPVVAQQMRHDQPAERPADDERTAIAHAYSGHAKRMVIYPRRRMIQ